MVICRNCKLTNVKVLDQNFAKKKEEGQPSAKNEPSKEQFYCWSCHHTWNSNPDSEKLYLEYTQLKGETTLIVHDMHKGQKIEPQHLSLDKMMRATEIAKELVSSHRHTLDIDPSEWFDIEQEAQL